MRKILKDNWFGILLVAVFTLAAVLSCDRYGINYDEYYTMSWCRLDIVTFWKEILHDTSPFLYYLMVWSVLRLTGHSILCARLFSVLSLVVMLGVGITFVKKSFGRKAMLFYCCILYLNPFMLYKATEIRMYGWASAFVLLSGVLCYQLMAAPTKKKWVGFTVFSLLAACTHYYAVLTLVFLYLGLLCYYLFRKNQSEIRRWFVCAAVTVVSYLPFLLIAIAQIKEDNGGWIEKYDSRLGVLRELFYSQIGGTEHFYILLMAGLTLLAFLQLLKERTVRNFWSVICCSALWGILAFGIVFGELVKPILLSRYLIVAVCLLFLGVTPVISRCNRYLILCCCIFMALVGGVNYNSMQQIRKGDTTKETCELVESEIRQGDLVMVIRGEDNYLYNCVDYYIPQAESYYVGKADYEDIKEKMKTRQVWVFDGTCNLQKEDFRAGGIDAEDLGRYQFTYTEFELFKLMK